MKEKKEMNLEEAKVEAQRVANKLQEPTCVVSYGAGYVVETKDTALRNGLRRIYDAEPKSGSVNETGQ